VLEGNKYMEFVDSVEGLNYSNYHVVYVDDFSEEEEVVSKVIHLSLKNLTVKNKIKIVHTLQDVGALGTSYYFINKYCKRGEIVVAVTLPGKFIGSQALQVINSIFNNKEIWFLWSNILENLEMTQSSDHYSQISPSEFRYHFDAGKMRKLPVFRKEVFEKIPLEAVVEYILDEENGEARPRFYGFGEEAFLTFPML
jgi:hypothetical protein